MVRRKGEGGVPCGLPIVVSIGGTLIFETPSGIADPHAFTAGVQSSLAYAVRRRNIAKA